MKDELILKALLLAVYIIIKRIAETKDSAAYLQTTLIKGRK